jgi:prepilin-type N-terminal cleavage/methylation domain-containing protein/prepilin-type processing-associated H-X9-DG protein
MICSSRSLLARRPGFTIVELLVTIAIIAALAGLVFLGTQRARQSAAMAANLQNLRSIGSILMTLETENGTLPLGYNWATGQSWATLVADQSGGDRQSAVLISPLVTREIPPRLRHETVSNYAANPIIFPDNQLDGSQASLKYRMTPLRLMRPQEQILLGDALPRSEKANYGHSMIIWWALRGAATGNNWSNPPQASETMARRPIQLPAGIEKMRHDGGAGLPAFRNRGKGHFLFADGHVEALAPGELKQKHFAISY